MPSINLWDVINAFSTDKRNKVWIIWIVIILFVWLLYLITSSYTNSKNIENRLKNIERGLNIENKSWTNSPRIRVTKDDTTEIY